MSVTLIYTNWKRKDNLLDIIESAKQQTYPLNIIVIDNSSQDHLNKINVEGVSYIKKNNDLKCWERWIFAKKCQTEYVCIMDDDLIFSDNNIISDCVSYMNQNYNVDCIGYEGVVYSKHSGYWGSEHYTCNDSQDIKVNIVKGRFMFIKTDSLSLLDDLVEPTCDDIKVSSILDIKVLPKILYGRFEDLPYGDESLSQKSYQQVKRDYAVKSYFK